MKEIPEELQNWTEAISAYTPMEWERLPELDLYMDQVITLMDKLLSPFSHDGDRLLTSSMINNYVKDGVLPRPEAKKYSRDHLARLFMICMLKSVLSLPEINTILQGMTSEQGVDELYQNFIALQSQINQETASRIEAQKETDDNQLYQLAMAMALEANARRIAAAHILESLTPGDIKEAKEKDKEKKKKDKEQNA